MNVTNSVFTGIFHKHSASLRRRRLAAALVLGAAVAGCSSDGGDGETGVGGGTSAGGASSSGGQVSAGGTTTRSSTASTTSGGGTATGSATGGSSNGGATSSGTGAVTGGAPSTGGTGAVTGGAPSTGGSVATGGVPSTGGSVATGGVPSTGGTVATGGVPSTGGTVATGGVPSTGGTVATGGVPSTGGTVATGGVPSTGGSVATGGVPSTGGTTSTGTGTVTKSAGCGKTRTIANGTRTIKSSGVDRSYILRVPDNYKNDEPYRLVVAYHWMDGNAPDVANGNSWASQTPYYGLWNLSNNSTIFIAPQGLKSSVGGVMRPGWANPSGQDVKLTDDILAELENDLCIDTSRIFATGFSWGGGMTYAIACARANVFRAVAVYSGSLLSGCDGGKSPIAYFAAHGINDGTLNISGGRSLRDTFVANNGCTSQSPPEPAKGSGKHTCTKYSNCSAGHPLTWCAFDGDHTPNPSDAGQSTSWTPKEVWDFFSQF